MDARIREIVDWVLGPAKRLDLADFVGGVAQRLVEMGLPIDRAGALLDTLHPSYVGMQRVWEREKGTRETRARFDHPAFVAATLKFTMDTVQETGAWLDLRLDDPRIDEYDLLPDLRAQGYTHYILAPLDFVEGPTQGLSFATKRPSGFSSDDIALIDAARPAIAATMELKIRTRVTREVLQTYVGNAPGELILAGHIRRGDVRNLRAALAMSDLRGFTAMSDALTPEETVARINDYLDCLVPHIQKRGGEVLKFIGDGVLAMADADAMGDAKACAAMLDAALAAQNALAQAGFRAGIALHLGQAAYGNIGAGDRLDFTVIGRDVNLVARLEKMCGTLGENVVVSAEFAAVLDRPWRRLGEFSFKGFEGARPVYAPG
jgi:adenylate cyclase